MAQNIDLELLLPKIKETRDRLDRLAVILDQNDRELALLEETETLLKDNLSILKKKNIIAMATEYRKIKDELSRTRNRMTFLNIDRETYLRAYATNEHILATLRKQYADILRRTQNNVIKGKFGKKDGG